MAGSRWFLSGVEARAFKSVGSYRLKVSFKTGLTCIVGPNGSGKSNLLEAICFACGSSPSLIGVKRLADLQCTDVQEVCNLSGFDMYMHMQPTNFSISAAGSILQPNILSQLMMLAGL